MFWYTPQTLRVQPACAYDGECADGNGRSPWFEFNSFVPRAQNRTELLCVCTSLCVLLCVYVCACALAPVTAAAATASMSASVLLLFCVDHGGWWENMRDWTLEQQHARLNLSSSRHYICAFIICYKACVIFQLSSNCASVMRIIYAARERWTQFRPVRYSCRYAVAEFH